MIRKSKKISLCIAALILAFMFEGCSSGNMTVSYQDSQEDITTITFFGNKYEPENVTVIEEIISGFMDENPNIRVSYESLKGTNYYETLEKRMAAGKGNDVFMVNHDILLKLKDKNQLKDLSGLKTISKYTPLMLSQMSDDGKIYWLPTTISAFGLYCNKTLMKKYNQKTPENINDWKEVCSFFKEHGITPIIANNDISLKTLAIGKSFFTIYNDNKQKEVFDILNSGEAQLSNYLHSGFSVVEGFINKGYINAEKALNTNKTSDDLNEFVMGESPFMLTGAWAAGRVKSMNPDFDFEVIPYPVLDDGYVEVINADTRLSINADSENQDAAVKFVEYFTKAENIQKFADQQSSFSPLKEGKPSSVKEIKPLISCYKSGRTVIGSDGLLNIPIWDLTADVSLKLLSGDNLTEIMAWIDQKAAEERRTP